MQEVTSGAAECTLQTLKDILQQLSECSQTSNTAEKIIANIKSTMSDRASAQKSFNSLLADYRADILPNVTENWGDLTDTERQSLSQMHNFYCGMHLVVNMAEHASETLKLIERNYEDTSKFAFNTDNESGTLRLIRTACKAFERRGDERNGCPLQFAAYLKRKGVANCPLIHFRGNRFNVIFANGARVYKLRGHIVDFLQNVWGTPNRLLKAVLEDMCNDNYIAGCKALGLVDKLITGPLWRILESDVHILDIPEHYRKLKAFLSECTSQNITAVMRGKNIPFDVKYMTCDGLWEALVAETPNDSIVQHLLLSLFKSFELLLDRVLLDHQPVLTAAAEDKSKVTSETTSVKTTNTISERDFAQLDRLLREKPNATMLALEAHILFSNNRTSEWLEAKSPEQRSKLFDEARKNAPLHRQKYRHYLSTIEKERIKMQQQKQMEREASARKLVEAKEKITSELLEYGLWVSAEQVLSSLIAMKTETQKRAALKAQLRFRKTVLQQQPPDDTVYKFSMKGKGQYTSQLLKDNLLRLIFDAASIVTDTNTSTITSLSGKCIEHNFSETDGSIKAYKGKVISEVPGFRDWYNVVYTEEPDIVYTFKLKDDIENSDLKIIQ